jgi:hypothetical protein
MNISTKFLFFVFAFNLFSNVNAQDWVRKTPPTKAFNNSQAIFSARIEQVLSKSEINKKLSSRFSSSNFPDKFAPKVKIKKFFKRADAFAIVEGDKLILFPVGLAQTFIVGEDWLFYVNYDETYSAWVVSDSTRTQPISSAGDDLRFFASLPNSINRRRISGSIVEATSIDQKTQKAVYKPMANIPVEIRITNFRKTPNESSRFTVNTDENGIYEIYDFPDGAINIYPKIPDQTRQIKDSSMEDFVDFNNQTVIATGKNFIVYPPNSYIKGNVTDENGKPVRGITVTLVSADSKIERGYQAITDQLGKYTIEIQGNYNPGELVALAKNGKYHNDPALPYPKTFYPSVRDRAKAGIIRVKNGETVENIDIKFSSTLKDKTISGKVVFNNGEPVNNARVTFDGTVLLYRENHSDFYKDYYYPANAQTNDGNFSLTAIEESDGVIRAELFYKREVLEKCLNRKLDLPEDQDVVSVSSKSLRILLNTDIKTVQLKFLIPPCEPNFEPPPNPELRSYRGNHAKDYPQYGKLITYSTVQTEPSKNRNLEFYDLQAPRSVYENSAFIVSGKVENLVHKDENDSLRLYEKYRYYYDDLIQLRIEKIYKSADIYGLEIGDFIYVRDHRNKELKIGETRIFYLDNDDNAYFRFLPDKPVDIWFPNYGINSVGFAKSKAYIDVLESPQKRHGKRISGYVSLVKRNYNFPKKSHEEYVSTAEPLSEFSVSLKKKNGGLILGKSYLAAKTDKDGYYEFENLPADEYWITAVSAKYLTWYGQQTFGHITQEASRLGNLIDLNKQDEVGIDFDLDYNGQIKGKVLDENGTPIIYPWLKLLDYKTLREPENYRGIGNGNHFGEYKFVGVPPGRYLLAVIQNPWFVNFEAAYLTTYFPDSNERANAQPIEIGDPPIPKICDIVVNGHVPTKNVSGTVSFQTDTVSKQEIFVEFDGAINYRKNYRDNDKENWWYEPKKMQSRVENGKFSLSIPQNTFGKIKAYTFISSEQAVKCLGNQGLPKQQENGLIKIYSTDIDISIKSDLGNLRLKFLTPKNCFQ